MTPEEQRRLAPHPYFERPLLPPALPPAPIPGLAKPRLDAEIVSETIEVDAVVATDPLAEIMAKVRLEDERMRILLPPAPRGYEWRAEIQTGSPVVDFERGRGDFLVRLAYRLVEVAP